MKTRTTITREIYDQVKGLLAVTPKLSKNQIVEITKLTWHVVHKVSKAKSYEEVKRHRRTMKELGKVTPKTFDKHNSVITLLRAIEANQVRQNELLAQLVGTTKAKKALPFWVK